MGALGEGKGEGRTQDPGRPELRGLRRGHGSVVRGSGSEQTDLQASLGFLSSLLCERGQMSICSEHLITNELKKSRRHDLRGQRRLNKYCTHRLVQCRHVGFITDNYHPHLRPISCTMTSDHCLHFIERIWRLRALFLARPPSECQAFKGPEKLRQNSYLLCSPQPGITLRRLPARIAESTIGSTQVLTLTSQRGQPS